MYYSKHCAYPELFALIGPRVPDYRGLFLRGYGSHISNHYGSVNHASGALGVIQGDAIRDITGNVGYFEFSTASGAFHSNGVGGRDYDYSGGKMTHVTFLASRVVPTANENRPVNQAVRYFIRAKS